MSTSKSKISELAADLANYNPFITISRVAGLLTVPKFQANFIRLEALVHLAVAYCAGNKKPDYNDLEKWLNHYLGETNFALMEDPVEDVFLTNIETSDGNRRIFEGGWESSDYSLQIMIETLLTFLYRKENASLIKAIYALIRLSDCVADRLGLERWHAESSTDKDFLPVTHSLNIKARERAVAFSLQDLEKIGVTRETIAPFIMGDDYKRRLVSEAIEDSSLHRYPLVEINNSIILALPQSVSPAIRQFVLSILREAGHLSAFSDALTARQAKQLEKDALSEIKKDSESLQLPSPHEKPLPPPFHSWLLRYDLNKYIHIVLLHDNLDWLEEEGFSSILEYPEVLRKGLEKYLNEVAIFCKSKSDYADGMTLVVMGGLGRGFSFHFDSWPNDWGFADIRLSDLLVLAKGVDQPIKEYFKSIAQKRWAEKEGVEFHSSDGSFNFYCYWKRTNFQLIPRDVPVANGTMISMLSDFMLPIRQEIRQQVDRHLLKTISGRLERVVRHGQDAYFESMKNRPIYVSITRIRIGILAGVVETSRGSSWLVIKPSNRDEDEPIRHFLYEIWTGFLSLYENLLIEIEAKFPSLLNDPIEVRLNFGDVIFPKEYSKNGEDENFIDSQILINHNLHLAVIKLPEKLFLKFQQPENVGEKFILRAIAQAVLSLYRGVTVDKDDPIIEEILCKIMNNSGMRIIHLFQANSAMDLVMMRQENKHFLLSHEDFVFSKLKLAEGCIEDNITELHSKEKCNVFLNKLAEKIWRQLRELLHQFDRGSVIGHSLSVHESVIQDREHWRRTAQAVIALHSSMDDVYSVALKRESDRNHVALSARTIIEMAICECPASGGRLLSQWDLDMLLAKAALLFEVAGDSDAINNDLVEPFIQVHINGEYALDHSFHETVINPFFTNYFREEYEDAADDYAKLYCQERSKKTRADEIYSQNYLLAFKEEFGLTPDEAIDGLAELFNLAMEYDNNLVEITTANLRDRLIRVRGLSPETCDAFIRTFGLFHRQNWETPPTGFRAKDIYPWRYRRRLSAAARPLLILGDNKDDKILYGVGSLAQSVRYLMQRTEQGWLPEDFFISKAMKSYIGAINDERGHSFAKSVAAAFHDQGWQVRNEVQMTELGAPSELGDIDVLAWKPTGEILLIECKRLQFARSIAEIAEICRRFRGEAKDELDKHLKRVNWVTQNPLSLERIVGFKPNGEQIDVRLVTNTHVPMMYIKSLPIPSNKIGPLELLI